ncbi:Metallo-dependent phosphatase-like protein [Paraphoma chrysanthemicola]|uniref:Metallo-dependent phosphatase-like protein n=1 Tax=Paraphoma chrysanthemicola TaxID=798071 RepID=A0A8K0R485_9PLEO|nr:Metallo-dependent phosphatase-like protein [Paraphoma chrysanthemicola]
MKRGSWLAWLAPVAVAAPVIETRHEESARYIPNYPGIQFNSKGRLSISVFSDLHFGEPGGEQKDWKTVGVMNSVLDNEHPDFAVLNGDMISCEFVGPDNYNKLIDQITSPLADRNLPFGATFGNHDWSETCSTISMSEHMWWDIKGKNGKKLSFTTHSVDGPVEEVGVSNYFVPVYSSSAGGKLAMLLWFFDSKGGRVFQPGKGIDQSTTSYVDDRVSAWFQKMRDAFNTQYGRVIPSLAFVHIPVQAARAFQKSGGYGENTTPGLNTEIIGHQDDCPGSDCYNHRDYSFMKALVETEGLMAVFSGHDHGVDWCMKWDKDLPTSPSNGNGVHFCFNRHSGFGGYSNWKRGARQILVEENKLGWNELETWNRLEDGSVSGRVTLNSTYGTDQYPKVKHLQSTGW